MGYCPLILFVGVGLDETVVGSVLVASIVDDILNGKDAQVGVDHCIGDIPWGVFNCSH